MVGRPCDRSMSNMSAPLKTYEGLGDIAATMRTIGADARAAARILAVAEAAEKNRALRAMAEAVRATSAVILAANDDDVAEVEKAGATAAFVDRLKLDHKRVAAIADGIDTVAALAD